VPTRADKIARMREWLLTVPEAQPLIAQAMRRNHVASVQELSDKHPRQFNSLFAAIEVMEEEMPEPRFPWPTT